jgi:hypothetical protein
MAASKFRQKIRIYRGWFNLYFVRMIIGTFARIYFGNDAGFRENRIGSLSVKKSAAVAKTDYTMDKRANFLKEFAYLELGYPHNAELIQTIKKAFGSKIQEKEILGEADSNSVSPALLHIPELKKLLNQEVVNLVRSYYNGGNFRIIEVNAWRNYYWGARGLKKDIVSNLPHNDFSRTDKLRIFVFLSDGVTKTNGATKIFPRTISKKIMRSGYFNRNLILWPASKLIKKKEFVHFMEGDTGFSFAFNPQLALHQAGLVAEGKNRDAICFTFVSSEDPLSPLWDQEIIEMESRYAEKIGMNVKKKTSK